MLQTRLSIVLSYLHLLNPTLLDHHRLVCHVLGVADLLDEASDLLLDLLEPGLGVGRLGGVHLVDGDDQLLDAEGVGEQGVLPRLPVLGDAGLELSSAGGDD